jgi:hypothetical protein
MRNIDLIKDHSNNALVIKTSQDCSDVIDQNKDDFNNLEDLSFGRKFASIPIDVLDAWIKEGVDYRRIQKDPAMAKKFQMKLNSPEFRAFRVHSGRI